MINESDLNPKHDPDKRHWDASEFEILRSPEWDAFRRTPCGGDKF